MLEDEPAAVDQPEQEQQEDRQDERELDQALAAASGGRAGENGAHHSDTVRVMVTEPAEFVTVRRTV